MHYLTIAVFVAVIILMFYFYFKLKKLVMQDLMTGVKNRNAFEMYVNKLTQKTRIENDLWLIIYDLDNLGEINLRGGHSLGDASLMRIGDIMKSTFCDRRFSIFRIGGDEFIVIAKGTEQDEILEKIAKIDDMCGEYNVSKGYAKIDTVAKHPFHSAFAEAYKMLYAEKGRKKSLPLYNV